MLFASGADVRRLAPMPDVIAWMQRMNQDMVSMEGLRNPLRTVWQPFGAKRERQFFGTMSASYINESNDQAYFGCKALSVNLDMSAQGGASHQGLYLLYEGNTGSPVLVADAGAVTELRTAANSAVALKTMMQASLQTHPLTLGIVGTGRQAVQHAVACHEVMKLTNRSIDRVVVCGRSREKLEACVQDISDRLTNVDVSASTLGELARHADAICTVTSAQSPILDLDDVRERETQVAILAVGACQAHVREIGSGILANCQRPILVDNRVSADTEAGEIVIAREEGVLCRHEDALLPLAEALEKTISWDKPILLYKSVGHSLQDLYVAMNLYARRQQSALSQWDVEGLIIKPNENCRPKRHGAVS